MAPSLVLSIATALVLSTAASAAKTYQIVDRYDSSNFFNKLKFFESNHNTGNYYDVDPTGGYVSYQSRASAENQGLIKQVGGELYLGVDYKSTLDPKGKGRNSVRVESNTKYKKGLFISDFSHFPKPTCGSWPALWTVGEPWPSAGEIDIYEAWNVDPFNRITLHTDAAVGVCRVDGNGMTAPVGKPNCDLNAPGQALNEGCSGFDSAAPFGSASGGIYAMEWTDDFIKVWGFTHANAPKDIATNPNPNTWGPPRLVTSTCEVNKVFKEQALILNIDFCGVAGIDFFWNSQCAAATKAKTCEEYVAKNPAAFKDTFFQLRSIKVYNLKDEVKPTTIKTTTKATTKITSKTTPVPTSKPTQPPVDEPSQPPVDEPTSSTETEPTVTPEVPEGPVTKTVRTTSYYTVTACPDDVPDCPLHHTTETTEIVPPTTLPTVSASAHHNGTWTTKAPTLISGGCGGKGCSPTKTPVQVPVSGGGKSEASMIMVLVAFGAFVLW